LRTSESSLGDLKQLDSSVVLELFLSYRNLKMFQEQINIASRMPQSLAELAPVQEQLALSLFRLGRLQDAEEVMRNLLKTRPSSESFAAFGRIYKELWSQERSRNEHLAGGYLEKAIELYVEGFEYDWRNVYPGLNAINLMSLVNPPDPRRKKLYPIVKYSIERRIQKRELDYWDASNMLQLAVLGGDRKEAMTWVTKCGG
jgi:tetratricopeptide (TPR) repeat protein